MQSIVRDYYEQLYTYRLDNPEETELFLKPYYLLRLNQAEI